MNGHSLPLIPPDWITVNFFGWQKKNDGPILFQRITVDYNHVNLTKDVIFMYNHSSHHSKVITDFINFKQAEALFTAPHSSHLKNIEYVWALFEKNCWLTI